MFPHSIAYIVSHDIPVLILKMLKQGLTSYHPDEFALHIEYYHVLEFLTRFAYQHAVVLDDDDDDDEDEDAESGHVMGMRLEHGQDGQVSAQIVRHLLSMTLDGHSDAGVVDCILSNVSLHDKKDVAKAWSILAQLSACCLHNNSSAPRFLLLEHEDDDQGEQDDADQDEKHSDDGEASQQSEPSARSESESAPEQRLGAIRRRLLTMERELTEMEHTAEATGAGLDATSLHAFRAKLNELKSEMRSEPESEPEPNRIDVHALRRQREAVLSCLARETTLQRGALECRV